MNKPLDAHRAKQKKSKNRLLIFLGCFALVVIISVFAMINATTKASKLAKTRTPVEAKSKISKSASEVRKTKVIDNSGNDKSPEALRDMVKEEKKKDDAKKKGISYVDSAESMEKKAKKIKAEKARIEASKVVEKPAVKSREKKTTNKPVMTEQQIIAKNMANLLKIESYYPPQSDISKELGNFSKMQANLTEPSEIVFKGDGDTSITYQNKYYQDKVIKQEALKKEQAAIAQAKKNSSQNGEQEGDENKKTDYANDPDMVRLYDMGEMFLGEIKRPINSDFNVEVFIDIAEPPLLGARIKANFQLTEAQDGIELRIAEMQYKDHVQRLNGYIVDVHADLTPLFDNDVDTHFFEKTLARASFAFVTPFLDYLGDSTTTVIGDTVVVEKSGLDTALEKVIVGVAGIGQEFLPDLQATAAIKSTVTVPANYPAGIILSDPLYLPKGLFDSDETTNPDKSIENVIGEIQGEYYVR